jgi:hypothetical protein
MHDSGPRHLVAVVREEQGSVNQRRLMGWLSVLLVAGALLTVSTGVPTVRGQDATPRAVTAPAPDWSFVVHGMQDPYAGTVTNPSEPASGSRVVAFDVEVVNASDQPLRFADDAVSVRDDAGFTYRGGSIIGGEPALSGRTLPAGERARGWVWFAVPSEGALIEILLMPVAPELRVGLAEVASIPSTAGSTSAADLTPSPAPPATRAVTLVVTPAATEPPVAAATSTVPPAAPQAPTSVITIESAETADQTPLATATPRAATTPAATATPAIVTSAPTATPPAVESDIEPGSTVFNADSDANLRAGPSLDAEIVGTIPLGSELEVTGPAVTGDDALWWPVIVVATGEEGYVADELLIPAEAG